MSNSLYENKDVRHIQAGKKLTRTAAALPLNAAGTIFTITIGRILVNALVGYVTTALGGTAQTITIGHVNTASPGGTSATCLGTSGSVTSLAATALIVANPGGATTISALEPGTGTNAGNGGAVTTMKSPYLLPPGSITITTNANNGTGAVQWDLLYTPMDDGAVVAAA
jgi:hypothetical protein